MSGPSQARDLRWDRNARDGPPPDDAVSRPASTPSDDTMEEVSDGSGETTASLSLFESIFTNYPPILESLLAQLPTSSVLDLYHTSHHLRDFFRHYPLAWKTLSFRLPQPAVVGGSPGNETPDNAQRQSKAYALDALLKHIVQPYGKSLRNLDLCNTAVSGIALVGSVLTPRIGTLQHLSVRGCKNVSIKYHIVPFLEPYAQKDSPWDRKDLALRSLYAYRCRHHRRRPYLPSSLLRRDSDTDPTHQLIEICHKLGIWTDTAWCPTPGGRCFRRKDYHQGRPGNTEVWVPFDRLWRSSNRLGPAGDDTRVGSTDGRLWEVAETGQDGEALGPEDGPFRGEGKHVPAHLRRSHKIFIDDVKCAHCKEVILERCESCSVRMHCMGCRKTLCASCAFDRPLPRKRQKTRKFASLAFGTGAGIGTSMNIASASSASVNTQNMDSEPPADRFWWAPGATRSPNLMNEAPSDDDGSDSEDNNIGGPPGQNPPAPKLNMSWCCLEPIFSGGGGIAVLGTGLGGKGGDKIRAAPLPPKPQYQDPDFKNSLRPLHHVREMKHEGLYEYVLGEDIDILSYLKQDSLDLQAQTCPRSLCQDCSRHFRWKVSCRGCKKPLCKEHDFRGLKVRKCGYRDLHTEREYARAHNEPVQFVIPAFKAEKEKVKENDPADGHADSSSSRDFLSPSTSVEGSDSETLSQSQILVPPPVSTTNTAPATSAVPGSLDAPANVGTTTTPFVPISHARPRSLSASGVRNRVLGSWSNSPSRKVTPITNNLPLPCNRGHPVQWEGCGAYFCQSPRPVGDGRPRCPSVLQECTECRVLVCDSCASSQTRCSCSFCTMTFHCPVCFRKPSVKAQCRLEDELKAKQEAEKKAKERMEKEKEMRQHADQLAENVWEFWEGLMGMVIEGAATDGSEDVTPNTTHNAQPTSETPTDKITVTTEFGVAHEPSHFTIITAGGPSTAAGPSGTATHIEDISQGQAHDSSPVHSAHDLASSDHTHSSEDGGVSVLDLTSGQDEDDDTEEDLNFTGDDDEDDEEEDEDDLDAESALIDEFLDPIDEVSSMSSHV